MAYPVYGFSILIMHLHRSIVPALLLPVLLLGVSAASAGTVTESVSFDSDDFSGSFTTAETSLPLAPVFSGSFAGFDSSLGTLESIELSISFNLVATLTLGASGGSGSFSGGGNVSWQYDTPEVSTVYSSGGGIGNGGGPFAVVPLNFSIISASTDSGLGFEKVADQAYTLTFTPSLGLSKPSDASASYALDAGTIQVTYTYSAVPEPASAALLLGLGALCLAGRRRRVRA